MSVRRSLWAAAVLLALAAVPGAEPQRVVIPPDAFRPEQGLCYIAAFDCGEAGDRESGNRSQLELYEDGRPLGPARALHAAIREQGGGRYSHWTRTSLYLSTSDGSDPRTNGRVYAIGSANPDNALLHPLAESAQPRTHTATITSSQASYTVPMGGTLDLENTLTIASGSVQVAFQPNVELVIANTGDTPVVNPRLVLNDRGNWFTCDDLLAEWTRGATNDQEKAYLLWQRMREQTYHHWPLYAHAEMHDPVRLFNIFGFNLCDDVGNAGCSLFHHAGLVGSKNRSINGHVQCEAMVDGRLQFLDVDMDCFYLDRENERPVSGDELAQDHDLVRRELNYGPVVASFQPSDQVAGLFGPDDKLYDAQLRGHTLDYTLRPGERAVFRWDNVGKYPAQSAEWDKRPPYFGNSQFVFEPRLAPAALAADAVAQEGLAAAEQANQLVATRADAQVTYAVAVPWLICGGTLTTAFDGDAQPARYTVELSLDGQAWRTVWERTAAGEVRAEVALDEALQVKLDPPKRSYQVRIRLGRAGTRLTTLRLATDLLTAPLSLPRLRLGENRAVYSDQTPGPHQVTITHRWQESSAIKPPPPPAAPTSPTPGEAVAADRVTYAWPVVEGAAQYHLQVSRRPDFAWPYRTSLDVIVPRTDWVVPFEGIYSPDTTYYGRLRSQDGRGVWGPWGEPWTFTWIGPRVPVEVAAKDDGGTVTLRWQPNPRGPRPVAYEVYGSDAKGFSVSREEHQEVGRGTVPANLLARTDQTAMVVVAPDLTADAANRVFYRVVAIDAKGTRSGGSAFAELPHPFVYSRPVTVARVGQPYRYQLRSLASLGDLQNKPGKSDSYDYRFWDIEHHRYALIDGPDWLKVEAATGVVAGTPPAAGAADVTIEVSNPLGGQARQTWRIEVQ